VTDRHAAAEDDFQALPPPSRPAREFWRLLKANRMAFAGLAIFAAFLVVAVAGLILTGGAHPYLDPAQVRLVEKLRPPLSRPDLDNLAPEARPALAIYLLGTDDLGRDVFARMLQGAWVSLTVGFVAVGISVAIGILFGGLAGYFGQRTVRTTHLTAAVAVAAAIGLAATGKPVGAAVATVAALVWCLLIVKQRDAQEPLPRGKFWQARLVTVDTLIMRLVDIMLCFPSFFLILTVVALLPPSLYAIMIVIGLTSWMGTTRFVRAEFLALREQDFVAAAKALGVSSGRIIFRHMMPNAVGPVLVSATIGIASAILTEAGLSFLGFGVPPPHATWGNILSDGKRFIFDAPWLTFAPGIVILVVVLAFNLFGEGLRDILNPKLRERS
jgi:peptide/nickel transport system permease protein